MKIREATYKDLEDIKTLCIRNGLRVTKINEEVWKNHPSINDFVDVPIGWVLENESKKIVGVILNLFMTYQLNGKNYKASVVSTWAVDDNYRSDSMNLIFKWIYQKNVDLLVDNRRTERSSKILKSFKFKNVPTKDYEKIIYWVLDYPNFIKSAIKKKLKIQIGPISIIPAAILRFYDLVMNRNKNFYLNKKTIEVESFDKKFDSFWNKLPKNNKFMAERNSSSLEWHFGRGIKKKIISVLTLSNENNLNGYIVIMRSDNKEIGLKRMKIADIQTSSNIEEDTNNLIANAIAYARKQGVHILELTGFGKKIREQALKTNPYVRTLSYSPFFYKIMSEKLKNVFSDDIEWDASLFDGDGSLDAID